MAGLSQRYFDKVKAFHHGDMALTWKWLKTPNPNLGAMSPLDAIRAGRINKVIELIDQGKMYLRS